MGRQIHLFIGYKSASRLNIELKHYGPEVYEALTDLTAYNTELSLNLPVVAFSVETPFPVRFLNISALNEWIKCPAFTQCLQV